MKYICPKCKKIIKLDWRKPWYKGMKSIKSFCSDSGEYVRIKLIK